jgi:tetratricopeptide (TPR) repeat protein
LEFQARAIEPAEIGVNLSLNDVLSKAVDRFDAGAISHEALEATFRFWAGMALYSNRHMAAARPPQIERALETRSRIFGETAPATLDCKAGLAQTLIWFFDERPRAERLVREALDGYERLGAPDERVLSARFTLSTGLAEDGRYGEAIEVCEQMLRDLDSSERPLAFAPFLPKIILARHLVRLGRVGEAERWLEQARREMEEATENGLHLFRSWLEQADGWIAARRGRWQEAEEHFAIGHQNDAAYGGEGTPISQDTICAELLSRSSTPPCIFRFSASTRLGLTDRFESLVMCGSRRMTESLHTGMGRHSPRSSRAC